MKIAKILILTCALSLNTVFAQENMESNFNFPRASKDRGDHNEDETRKDRDIYVYFKVQDGTWTIPINLRDAVNSNVVCIDWLICMKG